MQWKKLGKIFDPTQVSLPHGCTAFSQAPQALVFEDFVRIYFSTRFREPDGKYLSHIAFVDMKKNFRDIIAVSAHTVIELGKLGCFDEHGIFPMNVVRHGDLVYGYTSGVNRRVSVPADGAIGLAISRDDGFSFQRLGDGPVLAPSLHEPCIVVDPFVKICGDTFHMWYVFGLGWKRLAPDAAPDRVYKIGHATSRDGVHWTKEEGRQILGNRLGDDECQALPTVIAIDGRHHLFFCYRQSSDFRTNRDRAYRIGHAWSDDLVDWVRDDDTLALDVSAGDWDSDMLCYPHVFECDGRIYMLYNGNAFGRDGFGLAVLEQP
ncbi:MAG: hypothetical protein Q8R61_11665 [Thiobacillus sp.]|uniref:hypothetical protein n=1 Tax=Thiobacillus sp. TaxID=924 RepID=UPI0027365A15|nr:hypothetical protein [Thiobacillus sp.]MDP3585776.1 hypothetical protein [Thiobacillus sp.]